MTLGVLAAYAALRAAMQFKHAKGAVFIAPQLDDKPIIKGIIIYETKAAEMSQIQGVLSIATMM
jgi:hypothetical protein